MRSVMQNPQLDGRTLATENFPPSLPTPKNTQKKMQNNNNKRKNQYFLLYVSITNNKVVNVLKNIYIQCVFYVVLDGSIM